MSLSPPIRRLSTSSTSRQEELINAYEAEEERIINVLSRKLEQLREEKIGLENALEAESESHVNRLSRELTALRLVQQQQQQQQQQQSHWGRSNGVTSVSTSPETRLGVRPFMPPSDPADPNFETTLEALKRENEQLRSRLVTAERNYIRVHRTNEIYREELIEHRRRLGLSVDNLIGLSSDPLSQPTHHRTGSLSSVASPTTSVIHYPSTAVSSRVPTNGVPIPRPSSQIHRPVHNNLSESTTPLSHSPSSAESPFPFSPVTSTGPASYISTNTDMTSPASPNFMGIQDTMATSQNLSYPSVPPPSLASSIGSPTTSLHIHYADRSHSPVEPMSRRGSLARRGSTSRAAETGNLRNPNTSTSTAHRASVERGGRIAETGTLMSRSRAGSHSVTTTAIDGHRVHGIIGGNRLGFLDSEN